MPAHKPIRERFFAKVRKTDGCWLWTAATTHFGHGVMGDDRTGSNIMAHRLSWEIHRGLIPAGMCILHHCDNPPCVNPEHLFLGTKLDNIADSIAKGRHAKGETNGHAKLTASDIYEIFRLHTQHWSMSEIAGLMKCRPDHISRILSGQRWQHLKLVARKVGVPSHAM